MIPQYPLQPARLPATASALAVMITAAFLATLGCLLWVRLLGSGHTADDPALWFLLGILSACELTILGFYFGSSLGSWFSRTAQTGQGGPPIALPPLPTPTLPPTPLPLPPPGAGPVPPIPTPTPAPTTPGAPPPFVGRSTDKSTTSLRYDIPADGRPASIRYNNPGAQYPSDRAAAFGQVGYGIIGGGHKIAAFPHPINGAASNFDLLARNYVGMQIGAAGAKWTGDNGFGIPGYDSNATLTADMVNDPAQAIPILKAMAGREAGKTSPVTDEQWQQAHAMFKAGSADAWLASFTNGPVISPDKRQVSSVGSAATGEAIVELAKTRIGEKYVNVLVPKDDRNWHGPWDCAEFASWLVYQVAGVIYGCTNDSDPPHVADAYTGAWQSDAKTKGKMVSISEATGTPGAFLLRYPPAPGEMGHIVVSDGQGGTVEAAGSATGVVAGKVSGRRWDTGVLVPGIDYTAGSHIAVSGPTVLYAVDQPNMDPAKITAIQNALVGKGFSPGDVDGEYGQNTALAVVAFQQSQGLVADGEVGTETAAALGVSLL